MITKVEVLFCRISESEVDTEATTLSMVVLPAFSRESTTGNSGSGEMGSTALRVTITSGWGCFSLLLTAAGMVTRSLADPWRGPLAPS